ncbi:MAG: tyrosine-type recombinase/integrase, partial [Deltaproteobacteria bacterium]|nr:tyrosine-type recombinase/integrase [Deltaproteobacteria bacterium]
LRVSELAGLTRDSIHFQNHRIVVFGKGGPFGKKSKRRVAPMSHRITALLEHHFAVHESFGVPVRTIQHIVKKVADRAAITRPVSPHVLRHTMAVTAIQKGISLPAVQRILGHDHVGTSPTGGLGRATRRTARPAGSSPFIPYARRVRR